MFLIKFTAKDHVDSAFTRAEPHGDHLTILLRPFSFFFLFFPSFLTSGFSQWNCFLLCSFQWKTCFCNPCYLPCFWCSVWHSSPSVFLMLSLQNSVQKSTDASVSTEALWHTRGAKEIGTCPKGCAAWQQQFRKGRIMLVCPASANGK